MTGDLSEYGIALQRYPLPSMRHCPMPHALRLFLFSAFRIPTSEFLTPYVPYAFIESNRAAQSPLRQSGAAGVHDARRC
jgi:hypothetical protein